MQTNEKFKLFGIFFLKDFADIFQRETSLVVQNWIPSKLVSGLLLIKLTVCEEILFKKLSLLRMKVKMNVAL